MAIFFGTISIRIALFSIDVVDYWQRLKMVGNNCLRQLNNVCRNYILRAGRVTVWHQILLPFDVRFALITLRRVKRTHFLALQPPVRV